MTRVRRWTGLLRAAAAAGLFLATAFPTVLWVEAEKEIRILCTMLPPGTSEAQVIRTLNTGNLLRYGPAEEDGADPVVIPPGGVEGQAPGPRVLLVESSWTMGTSECRLALQDGAVATNVYSSSFPLAMVAAWVAAAGFLLIILHQLLLALGAPLGHLAWGGGHRVLPASLRLASALSAGLLAVGILAVLQKSGLVAILPWTGLAEILPWVLMVVVFLSLLGNARSGSRWERRLGMPLALLLALACLAVGLG